MLLFLTHTQQKEIEIMKQERYTPKVNGIVVTPPSTEFEVFLDNLESPIDIKLPLSRYSKEGDKLESNGVIYQIIQKIKVKTYAYKIVVKEFTF